MIVGVAVILLGGMGVYYALTGNDPLDALRRAVSGQSPIPSQTLGGSTDGFTTKGVTLDPRIIEPRGGPPNLRTATVRGTSVSLVPSALRGYIEAVKCYGKAIPLTSSYRSYSEQAALYASKPDIAAPPGSSLHERGLAIDVNTGSLNSSVADCLKRAGFFQGSTFGEPWHFSYGVRG
jgi:hypothetical protein